MRRSNVIKTAAASVVLSTADAKAHLNIESTFTTDDDLIDAYVLAATEYVEQYLQRKLINQTWYLYLDAWPSEDFLKLSFGDCSSVTSVKYYDTDDTEYTFSSDNYSLDSASVPGRIKLKYNKTWPTETLRPDNPIVIEYVTGYGAAASNIPPSIIHAIKFLVAHFYENREILYMTTNSNTVTTLEKTAQSLMYFHRIWDWIV